MVQRQGHFFNVVINLVRFGVYFNIIFVQKMFISCMKYNDVVTLAWLGFRDNVSTKNDAIQCDFVYICI